MLKKSTCCSVLIYAFLLITLAVYGYAKTQSAVSLYSGGGFGIVLFLSSLAMFANQKWGAVIAIVSSIILTAVFTYRYSVTLKATPAIMSILSAGLLLFLLFQSRKRSTSSFFRTYTLL
jgi:uncharacterized membrane protein (UPF0136 family)